MAKIKAVIIDDEKLARELIRNYLKDFPQVEVLAECSNGFEGIKAIHEYKPALVFLDIKMPKISGFEMLELLETKPVIIFSTAYDKFAIKAFESNAADYLLKPYSKERFAQALDKARLKIEQGENQQQKIENLVEFGRESLDTITRVVLRLGSKIHIIPVDSIKYIEAQDDYVRIHSNEGTFLKQSTMAYLESHLPSNNFVRTHRSNIVAIKEITRLEAYKKDSYLVVLKDNAKLPVSRSGYAKLKSMLKI